MGSPLISPVSSKPVGIPTREIKTEPGALRSRVVRAPVWGFVYPEGEENFVYLKIQLIFSLLGCLIRDTVIKVWMGCKEEEKPQGPAIQDTHETLSHK